MVDNDYLVDDCL